MATAACSQYVYDAEGRGLALGFPWQNISYRRTQRLGSADRRAAAARYHRIKNL